MSIKAKFMLFFSLLMSVLIFAGNLTAAAEVSLVNEKKPFIYYSYFVDEYYPDEIKVRFHYKNEASADKFLGDLDDNGITTAADARILLKASAQLITLSAENRVLADVDYDGAVTAKDARNVLHVSAGLQRFIYRNDDYFTKEEKLQYFLANFNETNDIIVGKPVEVIKTSEYFAMFSFGCILVREVDYIFRITDNLSSRALPEFIVLSCQLGDILEIGTEYYILPDHLYNALWDTYFLSGYPKYLAANMLSREDIEFLREGAVNKAKNFKEVERVAEKASLSPDFISAVDIALEVKILEKHKEKSAENIYDVKYEINRILFGKENERLLRESLRINSDVEVGGTYLILLETFNNEFVLPAARSGAVIDKNSAEFADYAEAFSSSR